MDGIDVFILGVTTGVLLHTGVAFYRLVGARKDVEACWQDLEALGTGAAPDALAAASAEYNQAANYYNDRLIDITSGLLARLVGYKPAPLIEDASTAPREGV
jgi:hypothetical protein